MVCLMIPLLCWTLCISSVSAEADQITVSAEPGQNVTLPCRSASSSAVISVQWRRTNGSGYVLLYRDGRIDTGNQNPSYQNRVGLMDGQVKDGDVSLVLRNVTTNDTGTYQCQVQNEDTKLIRTINLHVLLPPPGDKDGGTNDGSIGLIVGLILLAFAFIAGVSFLIYKKQSACFRKKTSDPPVDL